MDIVNSIFSVNIVVLILFSYQLLRWIKTRYQKNLLRKHHLQSFSHKSFLKWFTLGLFLLGLGINFYGFFGVGEAFRDVLIFQLYLLLILIETWDSIHVYDQGVIASGKFVPWETVQQFKQVEKHSYILEVKNKPLGVVNFVKVCDEEGLKEIIEDKLCQAKTKESR